MTDPELIVVLGEALKVSFPLHGPKWKQYQQVSAALAAYELWKGNRG